MNRKVGTAGLDLDSLDTKKACNKPFALELQHPITQAPLGVFIYVLGRDADVVREFVRDNTNKKMRQATFDARRGKNPEPGTVEKGEAEALEVLTVAVYGSGAAWETVTKSDKGDEVSRVQTITFQGEQLQFNPVNVKRVLTNSLWIRGQVDNAMGALENFIQA